MSKKIEVQQFIQEIMMNFGRIDIFGVQYKNETVFRNLRQMRRHQVAVQLIKCCATLLINSETFDTAEAIVTQRHNVILILHSL